MHHRILVVYLTSPEWPRELVVCSKLVSISGTIVTLLPQTEYPVVYIWGHRKEKENAKAKVKLQDLGIWNSKAKGLTKRLT
jgi:hypothetical protein